MSKFYDTINRTTKVKWSGGLADQSVTHCSTVPCLKYSTLDIRSVQAHWTRYGD